MKVEVTDIKAPNAANEAVADATNVQVKLWLGTSLDPPIDTGLPDILETTETITGGVLSIPLAASSEPTVGATQVSGTNANDPGATSTTLSLVHPGGMVLVVFSLRHSSTLSADISVTGTFDGVTDGLSLVHTTREHREQLQVWTVESTSKTANLVFTTGASYDRRFIGTVALGSDMVVSSSAGTTSASASSQSHTLTTVAGDLVLQAVRWFTSSNDVTGYSTNQTVVLDDDGPDTRLTLSSKRAVGTSTDVSTTITAANNMQSIGVVVSPSVVGANIGDPVLGVAKWEDSNETYFFPIDATVESDESSGP